jgi:4-diphosphocytidyl-2-C-methyl-D-erythritol kinase
LVTFPNCKINIGLRVLAKRADGYHDIETLFYPVPVREAVEIIADEKQANPVEFSLTGLDTERLTANNLCVKAYQLLLADFPGLPPVRIHLHKTIPAGAGLGGGSADAAFTLKALDKKFNLGLTAPQLQQYALTLGSDCPFFLQNRPSVGTGRGEMLTLVELDLSLFRIILVNPRVPVSTAEAFAHVVPRQPVKPLLEIIRQPIDTWKEELHNQFETPVFAKHHLLQQIKDKLYEAGARYASMSGSGSSLFGIFDRDNIPSFSFPATYWIKMV